MHSLIKSRKDFFAGAIFIVFGGLTLLKARTYEVGTAVDMGPGYFPSVVAILLILFGVVAVTRGLLRDVDDPIAAHRLKPLFLIFAAIVAFSLLIERAGLFIAAAALIGLACFDRLRTHPLEVLAIYVALTAFCSLVFVNWFDMQLPLFWWQ